MKELSIAVIQILPSLLWFGLAAFFLVYFRKPILSFLDEAIKRIQTLKIFGIEVKLLEQKIEEIGKEKSPDRPYFNARQVTLRAKRTWDLLSETKIIWVDDIPSNNYSEAEILTQFGSNITWATSTDDALSLLKRHRFDLIISDMNRGNNPKAGLDLLAELRKDSRSPLLIFYVGSVDREKGTPPGAFAITNHPDELFNFVMDVVERIKGFDG